MMTIEGAAFQDLEKRLRRVEKQNRQMKRVGLVVLLLGSLIMVMGQARPSRKVEAEQFILRDAQGRERLAIGTPRVSGAAIELGPDEPAIWIVGAEGQDRAIL